MKKNNFLLILGTSLIMVSMLAFSPFQPARSSDLKLSPAQAVAINSIDGEMQSIAGKYTSLTAITDPGDLLAYRWLAMAKDYVEVGPLTSAQGYGRSSIVYSPVKPSHLKDDLIISSQASNLNGITYSPVKPAHLKDDVIASSQSANLIAIESEMSAIVAKYGSLTAITDPGDLLAYRWLAMAKQYQP